MKNNKDHIVDKKLVEGLIIGNTSSFKQLYLLFERRLFHFVFSFTKSEYLSEEIVQEVFIKIWEGRRDININRSFDSYLYTMTRNLTYNYLRDSSRRKEIREELWINISNMHHQVETEIIFSEYQDIVAEIIEKLPQQKRSIYQLSKLEGRSHSEIAELLGISKKTVKNHLWKTMDIIRNQLQPFIKETILCFFILFF
ncbi:RNA polymerase sigma factor [Membranihabitans marinus]|uniref:RNA polymerase sigma factor n=1 Tax=Membranihabitans marinus TaxID=1227546 RepID=UPI001F418AA2|nr:RNA polymerase sigma-70 factor [Membranihabitans marinus]